jgi:hypothetical protein
MESSLTRGSERTRIRSETVTTTVFRSGSMGPDGFVGDVDPTKGVAVETAGGAVDCAGPET